MSRIGKLPVVLPKGVKAEVVDQLLKVEGPKGKLERMVRPEIKVSVENGVIVFARSREDRSSRAYHGMERALANNMVKGVTEGFTKELELVGVGYRADMAGADTINLSLGYSHPIDFRLPLGVKGSVVKDGRQTFIRLEGVDRQLVGQTAAQLRRLREPEPYQGKGVRYKDEVIKLKAGKAGKK